MENRHYNFDKKVREFEQNLEKFIDTQFHRGLNKLRDIFKPKPINYRISYGEPVIINKSECINEPDSRILLISNLEKRITELEKKNTIMNNILENDFSQYKNRFDKIYDYLNSFNDVLKDLDTNEELIKDINDINDKLDNIQSRLVYLEKNNVMCLE